MIDFRIISFADSIYIKNILYVGILICICIETDLKICKSKTKLLRLGKKENPTFLSKALVVFEIFIITLQIRQMQ